MIHEVFTRNGRWQARLREAYPYHRPATENSGALRLILGVGRSGTTWVSQVLARMNRPCRLLPEPLFRLAPPLPFHQKWDHTAVNYEPLARKHPLLSAYRLLVDPQLDGAASNLMMRNDPGWRVCLVQEKRFLRRFVPGREEVVERLFAEADRREHRSRVLVQKVLCVRLLCEMFSVLAKEFPCAKIVRYEALCDQPRAAFQSAATALGLPWDDGMEAFLRQTMHGNHGSDSPYSVMRDTARQAGRPFRFLSADEVALCREALSGLVPTIGDMTGTRGLVSYGH